MSEHPTEHGALRAHAAQALSLLALLLGLAILWEGALWVGNFIEDDTLISLRYAERFAGGEGLTFNDGERVEGYSNLSWVLLCALLIRLGVDGIVAVRFWSALCLVSVFVCLLFFGKKNRASVLGFAVGAVALGATQSLAVWSRGALEQPLIALGVMALVLATARTLDANHQDREVTWARWSGVFGSVLVLTRPDSPLFVLVASSLVFVVTWARHGFRRGFLVLLWSAAPPMATLLGHTGFRLAYYGDFVPNTAHIKTDLSEARAREGLDYVKRWAEASPLLLGVGAVGAIGGLIEKRTRPITVLVLLMGSLWTSYVGLIGGDHFPAFRHLLVVDVLLAALAAWGTGGILPKARLPQLIVGAALALTTCVLAAPYVEHQRGLGEINVAHRARWQWDGKALGFTFRDAFREEKPLWAVTAAGCLPYFSRLPTLDLLGLNDAHIARTKPDPRLPLAHDHGDGAYVLGRKPDLITFGLPRGGGPIFKSGAEMARARDFKKSYRMVSVRTLAPTTVLSRTYFRVDGPLGVDDSLRDHASSGAIRVPGYLLSRVTAMTTPSGKLGAVLQKGGRAGYRTRKLKAGSYRVSVEPPSSLVTLVARTRRPHSLSVAASVEGVLTLTGDSQIDVDVLSPHSGLFLETLVISRLTKALAPPTIAPSVPLSADATLSQKRPQLSRTLLVAIKPSWASSERLLTGGTFNNWISQGDAFGTSLLSQPRTGQRDVVGHSGEFAGSFNGHVSNDQTGDRATGSLTSPTFMPRSGDQISFKIGGGQAEESINQVGVRLIQETSSGPVVRMVWTGSNTEDLTAVSLDLSPFSGQKLRLQLFDDAVGGWGHIQISDVTLYRRK